MIGAPNIIYLCVVNVRGSGERHAILLLKYGRQTFAGGCKITDNFLWNTDMSVLIVMGLDVTLREHHQTDIGWGDAGMME